MVHARSINQRLLEPVTQFDQFSASRERIFRLASLSRSFLKQSIEIYLKVYRHYQRAYRRSRKSFSFFFFIRLAVSSRSTSVVVRESSFLSTHVYRRSSRMISDPGKIIQAVRSHSMRPVSAMMLVQNARPTARSTGDNWRETFFSTSVPFSYRHNFPTSPFVNRSISLTSFFKFSLPSSLFPFFFFFLATENGPKEYREAKDIERGETCRAPSRRGLLDFNLD